MKRCRDCGEEKPLSDFSPRKESPDGRAIYCKACFRERSKASYRRRQHRQGKTVRDRGEAPAGHKWCNDCQAFKPLDEFGVDRRRASGRTTYCKPCHNKRSDESRQRLYGGGREYHLRERYGIGQVHVDRILAMQGGKCAGCGKPDPEHVDHDHATGEVRGLLCFNCNQALGNVRDDARILENLIEYLQARRSTPLDQRLARAEPPVGPHLYVFEIPPGLIIEYTGTDHMSRR